MGFKHFVGVGGFRSITMTLGVQLYGELAVHHVNMAQGREKGRDASGGKGANIREAQKSFGWGQTSVHTRNVKR